MSLPPNKCKQPENDQSISDDDMRHAAESLVMFSQECFAQIGDVPLEKAQIQGETKVTQKELIKHDTTEKVKTQGEAKIISEKLKNKGGAKKHQCKVCLNSFSTGQELGGHQRKHYKGIIKKRIILDKNFDIKMDLKNKVENKNVILNIDLNKPAPISDVEKSSSKNEDEEKKLERIVQRSVRRRTDNNHHKKSVIC